MQEVLTHPYFKNIFVPVGTAVLAVFIKSMSKSHTQKFLERKDLAIGLDLCVTSLTVFTAGMVDLLAKFSNSPSYKNVEAAIAAGNFSDPALQDAVKKMAEFQQLQGKFSISWWLLLSLCIVTFSIAFLVRMRGWNSKNELTLWIGTIVPTFVGLIALIAVVAWTGV